MWPRRSIIYKRPRTELAAWVPRSPKLLRLFTDAIVQLKNLSSYRGKFLERPWSGIFAILLKILEHGRLSFIRLNRVGRINGRRVFINVHAREQRHNIKGGD